MKLSDGEKLILVMLSELYKNQKINGEVDPDLVLQSVCDGHTWGLRDKYHGIFDATEDDPAVVTETNDILYMWRTLERSYANLSDAEKKRVEDVALLGVKFEGFDANHEPHYGVARYLIDRLDKYSEFKGRNLAAVRALEPARRMFRVFEPLRSHDYLSADQMVEVLKAQRAG